MKKTVRRRHNKDGTVTKTTTYRHKNIFGTTVSDTYTEQVAPRSKRTIKDSNAAALIIYAAAVFIVSMAGIILQWRGGVIKAYAIFATIFFAAYMLINNVISVRNFVMDKLINGKGEAKKRHGIDFYAFISAALLTLVFCIIGNVSKSHVSNIATDYDNTPVTQATESAVVTSVTVADTSTAITENMLFPSDEVVNRFVTEYNAVAEYPIENISKGNIVTKGIAYSNGCHMEITNANDAGAEAFCISINAGNSDSAESHMIVVVRDIIKVLEPDLSEDEIDSKISELEGSGHTDFKVSNDLIITYYHPPVELSYGMSNGRADIYSYNYK